MAEAYCASKAVPGIRVTSSGIAAGRDGNAALSPWAAQVLNRHGLVDHAAANWQRTTANLLKASDVLIFMESEHKLFCEPWIIPGRHRVEVWDIEDIGPMEISKIPQKAESTFQLICRRVDELLKALDRSG